VMLLLGTGAGLAFPALMNLSMSSATREDAGLASGLVNTSAQVGAAVGLALLATLSATRTENRIADGISDATALVDGYHLAFWVAAGLVVAAIAVALVVLQPAPAGGPGEEAGEPGVPAGDSEPGGEPIPEPAYSEGS